MERELRAYLACGVLVHGFMRAHCDACGYDRLVAFSCKGRGFCPSCGGRRMVDTAAHLVERVLPEVDALQCPRCGDRMRVIAAITDPEVARRILMCLRLPPRAPPLAPAVSSRLVMDSWIDAPESWDFDQTAAEDWYCGP